MDAAQPMNTSSEVRTVLEPGLTNAHDDLVGLTFSPIDEQHFVDRVKRKEAGAVCTFAGTTRNSFAGREVTRLEYEAYEPLALKAMLAVADEARKLALQGDFSAASTTSGLYLPPAPAAITSSGLLGVSIVHRLGEVPPRETSILIAVSSAHRRESFAACEWILEAVKRRVPVWKREWYAGETEPALAQDGALPSNSRWKENFEPNLLRPL